ncbi:MAG: hypothetical protein ND866_01245 [Pyrinomonadaceae bacterium]|nr:hypothetical protein [Pyrinomonadaceae bacterium]
MTMAVKEEAAARGANGNDFKDGPSQKTKATIAGGFVFNNNGRGERIRTSDLTVPNSTPALLLLATACH